jgi:pimeloyl-ACP methyl ester carboxylesterase
VSETRFAELDGLRLAWDEAGSGPPLVLLHAGIVDRRMWDEVVPLLTDAFRVIRYDARGFGESSRAPDGQFRRWDDLLAVMDAAGVDRAHLVGVSQGAETALDATVTNPERVDHLVMVGSGLRGWNFSDDLEARWQAEVEAWERGDIDGCAEESMRTWFDGPSRTPDQVDAAVRRRAWEMQRHAIDIENDDAQAVGPEPPSAERQAGGRHSRRAARDPARDGAPAADGAAGRLRAPDPRLHRLGEKRAIAVRLDTAGPGRLPLRGRTR